MYWLCIDSNPTLRPCAPDLLFDRSIGQCNLATEVECDSENDIYHHDLMIKQRKSLLIPGKSLVNDKEMDDEDDWFDNSDDSLEFEEEED